MNEKRLENFREKLIANGLDGAAFIPGANLLYLSGVHVHTSERPIVFLVPVDDDPAIIIPTLEAAKAVESGIRLADSYGITLIGFARGKKMNIYTHPRRIKF